MNENVRFFWYSNRIFLKSKYKMWNFHLDMYVTAIAIGPCESNTFVFLSFSFSNI